MNALHRFVCFTFFSFVVAEEMYSTRFDDIDYEEILKSDRLLRNYANCLLDKGSCTPDGKELKRILPDALETNCTKCTDAQRKGARRVIQVLINNKPEIWKELMVKYDPNGEFEGKYEGQWLKDD